MQIIDVVWLVVTAVLVAVSVWAAVELLRARRRKRKDEDKAETPGTIEMTPGDFIDYGDYLVACACGGDSSFDFDPGAKRKVIALASGASFTSDDGYKYVCAGCDQI